MNRQRGALPSEQSAVTWQEQSRFVGWDGVAAILILLLAASDVGGWVENLPVGRLLVRALWCLLYVGVFLHLVQRFGARWVAWMTRYQTALCLLLAWALLSSLWSLAPLETVQKSLSLVGTTVLGVYIGYALPPSLVARVLRWSFAVVIVSSVVGIPLLPDSIVVEPLTGEWRGLMCHKNSFGGMAAFASLFFLATVFRGADSRWAKALCTVCLLALVATHSRTALVACMVGVGTLTWFGAAYDARGALRTGLLLLCVLGTAGLVGRHGSQGVGKAGGEPAAPDLTFGSSATINGRTTLWAGAVQIIGERPLTGYGYHVVWGRKEGTLLPHIPITAHRSAINAHNAVLNTATELGVPAAILLAAYCLTALRQALRFHKRHESSFSLFVVAFVAASVTMSVTESTLLQIHSVFWILFVALAVMLERRPTALGDTAASTTNLQ